MDSDRRLGIGLTLIGVFGLVYAVATFIAATGTASYLMSIGFIIGGVSISGVGAGILLGKVETVEGARSKRFNKKLAIAGVVVFVLTVLITIGILTIVE